MDQLGVSCAAYDSEVRVSMQHILQYFDTWTTRDFCSLGDSAGIALQDFEEVCQRDAAEAKAKLPRLRRVLGKLRAAALGRCVSVEDLCTGLVRMLDDAKDGGAAISSLFQVAEYSQQREVRAKLIARGALKSMISLMHRYASAPGKFKPILPLGVEIQRSITEPVTMPNVLRKCLVILGKSDEGLRALADAGVLGAMAAVMELAAGMDMLEKTKHGLNGSSSVRMDWPSVFLATACAVLPHVGKEQSEFLKATELAKLARLVCTPQKKSVMYGEIMNLHGFLVKAVGSEEALVEVARCAQSMLKKINPAKPLVSESVDEVPESISSKPVVKTSVAEEPENIGRWPVVKDDEKPASISSKPVVKTSVAEEPENIGRRPVVKDSVDEKPANISSKSVVNDSSSETARICEEPAEVPEEGGVKHGAVAAPAAATCQEPTEIPKEPAELCEETLRICDGPDCSREEGDVKFKVCSRCRGVAYCSVTCQRAHWHSHRMQCVMLQ